ncbi:MAG: serine/threonine-protein kinase [Myxococcota bacterium]
MNDDLSNQSTLAGDLSTEVPATEHSKGHRVEVESPAQLVGRRYGRYVVLSVLGHGGMGIVLEGYDEELDRRVALKLLHDHLGRRHRDRLRREAQAMAKLSHPNVVQVYEVGDADGQTFVAMELLRGPTVRSWMEQEPRPGWRASVEVFVQLGAGLAAAHERDLVHRDFKPDNAMLDEDGRARVLDFGLVRQWGDEDFESSTAADSNGSDSMSAREGSLTKTGALLGTPAYMSPEQMSGAAVDARSDQFNFCVALYEAVYGERPYEGDSVAQLITSMERESLRGAPPKSSVPARLRRVLSRGLAYDPAQRWPSMEALLAELRVQIAPRGRARTTLAVGVLALGLGGSWAFAEYVQVKDRCTGAEAKLDGVWDDERRATVKTAILNTALPYAPDTVERVEARLDAVAAAWVDKHTEVCEATAVRQEQSAQTLELRMGCLQQQASEVRAAVDVLANADATVVPNAITLASGLPDASRCDDVEALRATVAPPEPAKQAEVEALRGRLQELRAEQDAGRYAVALKQIEPVVAAATDLDYAPLVAEVMQRRGSLQRSNGHHDAAEKDLRKAYALAIEHQHDAAALDAVAELTFVVGSTMARFSEGRVWGETAMAHARRSRDDEELASAFHTMGAVLYTEGDYEGSMRHNERAVELVERARGPEHFEAAPFVSSIGNALTAIGKHEEATQQYERALRILEQALGPDHPTVAGTLSNLGVALRRLGELDRAKAVTERALKIREDSLGSDHALTAGTLANLCVLLNLRNDNEQARTCHERALRATENALGPTHPDVAHSATNLAITLQRLGKAEQAEPLFERALRVKEEALGREHPDVALALGNLGMVHWGRGEYASARPLYERALAILEAERGPEHPQVASTVSTLGEVYQRQGDDVRARQMHERALAIMEKALGPDDPKLAKYMHSLGMVLLDLGERDEARAYWERAVGLSPEPEKDPVDLAYPLVELAKLAVADGQMSQARGYAERAVAIREKHEADAMPLAIARFTLARALWVTPGERVRARALAREAREVLEPSEEHDEQVQEIERWLQRHGSPARARG